MRSEGLYRSQFGLESIWTPPMAMRADQDGAEGASFTGGRTGTGKTAIQGFFLRSVWQQGYTTLGRVDVQ